MTNATDVFMLPFVAGVAIAIIGLILWYRYGYRLLFHPLDTADWDKLRAKSGSTIGGERVRMGRGNFWPERIYVGRVAYCLNWNTARFQFAAINLGLLEKDRGNIPVEIYERRRRKILKTLSKSEQVLVVLAPGER